MASCNALLCHKYLGLGVSLNSKMMHGGLVGYPDILLLCIVHSLHIEALLVCFEANIMTRPSGPVIGFIQEKPTPSIRVSTGTPVINQLIYFVWSTVFTVLGSFKTFAKVLKF